MAAVAKAFWAGIFLLGFACLTASAQDVQFLPDLEQNFKFNSSIRANFSIKGDREGGDPLQFSFGPSIQLHLRPLVKLKKVTAFDLDEAKAKFLVLETGYLSITSSGTPNENRVYTEATSNFPVKGGFLVSDRNRADLDWENGAFTWRYRNKFEVERTFSIRSFHFIPYGAAEPYYESQYGKTSTTALYAGSFFPVGKHVQLETYYEHENNTGGKKNKQTENIGLTLHLYLTVQKH